MLPVDLLVVVVVVGELRMSNYALCYFMYISFVVYM